jgi:predicted O-methyltransferase YrrM
MMKNIREFMKKVAFRYTNLGAPHYPYNIQPIQLSLLVSELDRLTNIKGNVLEIGVARGMTTFFLCHHILTQNVDSSFKYIAIDTFESFTDDDIDYEVKERNKKKTDLVGFEYNSFEKWKKNMKEFKFLHAVKGDCSEVEYLDFSPIKLSLIDVDLYLPTLNALKKIYELTIKGGVIVVDDFLENQAYDGAYSAYMDFCDSKNIEPEVIGDKCGIIYKN